MNDNYEDIIDLPHYEPKRHARMPRINRAAQFAPFAALTGLDEAIRKRGFENIRQNNEKDSPYENILSSS